MQQSYTPILERLGVMNQYLVWRSIELGLFREALQLKRLDEHLIWLLEHKDEPEPNGDWDDMWANDDIEKFSGHFNRHRKDFGAKDWNDYAKKSQDFYKRFQQEKLPAVETKDGWIKVYDPKTNTFAVYNPEGKTDTFYKPTSPIYYEKQVKIVLSEGGRVINPLPN